MDKDPCGFWGTNLGEKLLGHCECLFEMEVVAMDETTTVDELHAIFAWWGYRCKWEQIMGPSSLQQDSNDFLALNNIHVKHLKSSPYYPATNGLVECFVQTLKQALQHSLASFLLNYRKARHSTTDATPATLMMGRDLQCRLSLLKPDEGISVLKCHSTGAVEVCSC